MKKLFFLLTVSLFALSIQAQNMKAFISHKAYCTQKMQPYIEFTFIVGGNTVNYVLDEQSRKWVADVDVRVDVKQGDSIVKTLHYILGSDYFEDSVRNSKPDFADIQNLPVPNGDFFLEFSLKDLHSDSAALKYIDRIQVNFPEDKISSSRISLYESIGAPEAPGLYVKYGKNMPPLYYNHVPEKQYSLPFAVEFYNTKNILGANKPIKAKCYIEMAESKLVFSPNSIITKDLMTDNLVLVVDQFNVFKLPSGNYNVVVELYDEMDSLLLINKLFFQKSNPSVQFDINSYNDIVIDNSFVANMDDRAVLEDYIRSLYPISSNMERSFFDQRMKLVEVDQLKRFFYSFWLARDPNNPEAAWNKYNKMVSYVQERFGSKQVKGYRTDRGRVYLQYGQPNDIKEVPSDPVTVPYEIWHYYYLDDQSNVKFVFYDPSLVGNDYELLHSNKYGEPYDTNWKMKLVKNLQPQKDIYAPDPDDYWGGDINGNWRYN
ncbi:MAG: GWxTD domain-containing protein [Bacteroidales bacterium]|nr:GWxTD domain-containing protein [Bacteroidales bacterium]